MRATILAAFLLISFAAHGAEKQGLAGSWKSTAEKNAITLVITAKNTYQWNAEKGRWMTQGSSVWFLTENKTGTKWDFSFEKDVLVLKNPEDFKYEGAGKYLYFQMTDPKTIHRFEKAGK